MVQKGDTVTVESGMLDGQTGTVVSVDAEQGLAIVEVEMFGQTTTKRVMVEDLTVKSDDPDEVLTSVTEKIRAILREPVDVRQKYWWARRAHEGMEPGRALLEEFEEFAREMGDDYRVAVAEQLEALKEAVDTDSADAIRAWYASQRDELEREASRQTEEASEQLRNELFSVAEIEATKKQALDDPNQPDILSDEDIVARALRQMLGEVSDRGFELWKESEEAARESEGAHYAYDEIGAGPVDLDFPAPKDEVAEEETYDLKGPTSVEPAVPPPKALQMVAQGDTAPLDALRTLAVVQPGEAIETLRAKQRELRGGSGGDFERLDFASDIDTTLLSFDEDDIWRQTIVRRTGLETDGDDVLGGLATRERSVDAFTDNPWGIAEDASLEEALDAVWGPLEQRLPNGVYELRRRVLAVGQIESDGEQRLVYLVIRPHDAERLQNRGVERGYPGSFEVDALPAWIGFGSLVVLEGTAPSEEVEVELEEGRRFQLPMSLRELRSRHATFGGHGVEVGDGFQTLAIWCSGDAKRFRQTNGGASPDRFVAFGHDGHGNAFVFDRDELDARNDPQTGIWNRQTWNVGDRRPFWKTCDVIVRHLVGRLE